MQYTGYRSLADNNNFLPIFPQGTVHPTKGGTHWNIGAFTSGSSVNDLGFIQYIIDWLKDTYNFNHDRIYANGMSNGGFMSHHLACYLGHEIAAMFLCYWFNVRLYLQWMLSRSSNCSYANSWRQ